jgi:ATP-dependent RNA helicase DHX8/PRP22
MQAPASAAEAETTVPASPPNPHARRPDSLWPHTLLGNLQRLSCQRKLYGILERHLGMPGKGEEYLAVARMLMNRYEDAVRAVRGCLLQIAHSAENPAGPEASEDPAEIEAALQLAAVDLYEAAACVFVALLEYEAPVPATAADIVRHVSHIRPLLFGASTTTGASEADDWSLPPQAVLEATKHIHANLAADLPLAVKHGIEILALEQEREEAAEALRTATAAAAVHATSKASTIGLSSEDRFVLNQLRKVGAADLVQEVVADEDEEDPEDFVEIELVDDEPRFLKGRIPKARTLSYRVEAMRNQREALNAQNKTFDARTMIKNAAKAGNTFASMAQTADSNATSMEAAASKQQEYARERRELRARARRLAAAGSSAGIISTASGAEERTTKNATTAINQELDERLEEQGMRSRADLPVGALPPWLRPKGGGAAGGGGGAGGKGSRGGDNAKDALSWGITTNLTIAEQRARLPIAQYKQQIVDFVNQRTVTVLVGETGSGKTTQLSQYLAEAGYGKRGIIGCTQPRRVAATSLAERVAAEYGCRLGEEVGYSVRFQDKTSDLTIIKYLTDGMLLREALGDDQFSAYSVIILDEAHERSLNTDVLLGLVKAAAKKRNGDLKVIVTSATLDTDKFLKYFEADEALKIPGRTFPVALEHAENPVEDYVDETLHNVMTIHLTAPPGDILCFLTGQDEIETVAERLHQWSTSDELEGIPPLVITVIFGALPQENQSIVFEKTPRGSRKVVLATNIAETSITIDELFYVVDCGFCKQNIYDPKTNAEALRIVPISKQQARQRMGRAGRTGPGKCVRLYTEQQFEELPDASVPEIQRTNLINVILTLKATGVHDLLAFDFLDPPKEETLVLALEKLYHLGALDTDGVLTKIGSRMSELPLEPAQCKTLLTALDLGCASTVLTVVSMLSTQNVFYRPRDRQEEADMRKSRFTAAEGDQMTLLNVYDAWIDAGATADWCSSNFVQHRALRDAKEIRSQLERILSRRAAASAAVARERRRGAGGGGERHHHHQGAGGDCLGPEQGNRDPVLVRKALTAGYFFQAAKRTMNGEYRTLTDRRTVAIHPSSALCHSKPRYVIYHELVTTTRDYMRNVMAIKPAWLTELAPNYYSTPPPGRLTKEQMAERLAPKLRRHELGQAWRITKVRQVGYRNK